MSNLCHIICFGTGLQVNKDLEEGWKGLTEKTFDLYNTHLGVIFQDRRVMVKFLKLSGGKVVETN